MVFQHVGLLWIINNSNHLKFEMYVKGNQWMNKVICYNTTIYHSYTVKAWKFVLTGCNYSYELMCAVNAYTKYHVPMPDFQVVAVPYQFQERYLKKQLSRLVIQWTVSIIGCNALKKVMIKESWFLTEILVSYSKQSQYFSLQKNWWL